jgi:poly-beta-1,6-N-acetyl-D-glucosamine synthase
VLIYLLLAPGESIIVPIAGGLTLEFTLLGVLLGFFFMDYVLTVVAAMIEKKPVFLLYGPGFFLTRYIDSFLFLYTLPLAFTTSSAGTWKSPRRRGSET